LRFGWKNIKKEEIFDKDVIEVGAYNVNGSLRSYIKKFSPKKYVGVDIQNGECVDMICDAVNLVETFGKESFDFIITTEMLEHVEDWKCVINNLKDICKPNGIIFITTRSKGFGKHDYPYDHWRYEIDDMKFIFSDCQIITLQKDTRHPGVFIKVIKPENFNKIDLQEYRLFHI